jgi:peroxiredoxin
MKYWKLLCTVLSLVILLSGCAGKDAVVTEPTSFQLSQLPERIVLGSKMPALTVTAAGGETLQLEELLQQKKMVVLNFWFADCIWCIREFPVMEASYQNYKQDVQIIALNPYDSQQTVASFQQEHSLSFPMASCSHDLAMAFGINSYPTSVVIDREGRVCLIHSGAITQSRVFDNLFETFTADDYTPRVYHSITEII